MIEFTYSSLNGLGDVSDDITETTRLISVALESISRRIAQAALHNAITHIELNTFLAEHERIRQRVMQLSQVATSSMSAHGLAAHLTSLQQTHDATSALDHQIEQAITRGPGIRGTRFVRSTAAVVLTLGGLGVLAGWLILSKK